MGYDLTNQNISDTFQNLLQKTGSGNQLYDLRGNEIGDLTIAGATPFDIDGVPNSGDEYYTYLWEDGTNTEDRTSLDSGVYVISITDANGCIRVDSFELFNPSEILSSTLSNDVSCLNTCDGTASVAPISGIPPFTFLWSNGDTTEDVSNLLPGNYILTVTDSNGCDRSDSTIAMLNPVAPVSLGPDSTYCNNVTIAL